MIPCALAGHRRPNGGQPCHKFFPDLDLTVSAELPHKLPSFTVPIDYDFLILRCFFTVFCSPRRISNRSHFSELTGITDSLEIRTSSQDAKRGSSLMRASVRGSAQR